MVLSLVAVGVIIENYQRIGFAAPSTDAQSIATAVDSYKVFAEICGSSQPWPRQLFKKAAPWASCLLLLFGSPLLSQFVLAPRAGQRSLKNPCREPFARRPFRHSVPSYHRRNHPLTDTDNTFSSAVGASTLHLDGILPFPCRSTFSVS